MTTDGGEGRDRHGWHRRLPRDPALTTCIVIPAAMALAGVTFLVYGAGQGSTHTMGSGGDWLFFAFFLTAPMKIGWWLRGRQRKITVEQKLDDVQDGLDRVEDLLTGAAPTRGNVVRPLRRRLILTL